jgi:chromosome segregation ATPase
MNDSLAKQLEDVQLKYSDLEKETVKLRKTESGLKVHCTCLETELDHFKAQAAQFNARPSKDELERDVAKLREQLQQAEERMQLSASQILEGEKLRQDEEREAVKLKVGSRIPIRLPLLIVAGLRVTAPNGA